MTPALSAPVWTGIEVGGAVAVAEREALGTSARVAVWPRPDLASVPVAVLDAVDLELAQLDLQASRFREDSELSRVHRAPGQVHQLSHGLAEAVRLALRAAEWTGGLVDPTVGATLVALGYDRDFAAVQAGPQGAGPRSPAVDPGPRPAPGWRSVRLDGTVLRRPAGLRLDLGATAKGLGADRAAAAARACGSSVLVSLGGDIAVAGRAPDGGWLVAVADCSDAGGPAQVVRLAAGGLATSSVTARRWNWAGRPVHHIVDPRSGRPADGPWRTVSVAAASCAEADAAATAAIVAGPDAEEWLGRTGLPARLVGRDGAVRRLGGWPAGDGAALRVPSRGWLA